MTRGPGLEDLAARFRARHDVPAVGLARLLPGGGLEVAVTGVLRRGGGEAVAPGDAWHIGSCGKAVTALLFGRLVDAGTAAWEVPVARWFPDLAGDVHPGWSGVTLDQVLVCEAGLPANLSRQAMLAAHGDTSPVEGQRTAVVRAALREPPARPGRFVYSNLGYILVGAAIERITGTPFEAALRTHVLDPLGLGSAGFGPPDRIRGHGGRMRALGALGMFDIGSTRPMDPAEPAADNPRVMGPAGRLHVSLADWARLLGVFAEPGAGFLRPDTRERILTPSPGRGHRIAMGWAMARTPRGMLPAQQGSNASWVATAVIDPSCGRGALVACNEGTAKLLRRTPALAVEMLSSAG